MYALVPEGPHLAKAARFDPGAVVRAFGSPAFRASASGYFGHMWELYTLWAFVPHPAVGLRRDAPAGDRRLLLELRHHRGRRARAASAAASCRASSAARAWRSAQLSLSGLCCLLSPLAFTLPASGFLAFMVFWGIVVVGDSPQFSALNAATAPKEFVGSALTIVNCIGFAITVVSVQVATWLAQRLPMEWWFVPVAVGPALGLYALRPLTRR